ncbi:MULTISPECIES: ECF transporter S component [unclassified Bacillus (in: firmicutes)]|uniref:ECF transporter S component n=1 Tax=unclassified Bacillus (in: firmicutes) TaxID=185979 RepID=UPI000B82F42E|nr:MULTISPECIES: ECF transporter S component [unclassified Bacillus (in: firmicutes)]
MIAGFLLVSVKWEESYLWLSFAMVGLSLLMFLIRFEKRKVEPRELVLIAVLAAIAAVGRIPFASIPSVQPTTFIIMMSGFVFGSESGFLIGAVAALASNMILGQGPWTPWQMVAWGLVGMTAGLLRKTPVMNNKYGRIFFGIVWGFLFGLIMNVWGLLSFIQSGVPLDYKTFITYFGASVLFDSMHAVSNVFFLLVFSGTWLKILMRFKSKYGLLER